MKRDFNISVRELKGFGGNGGQIIEIVGTAKKDYSRSWWWTGRPGVLRFMGSQRVGHDWVTELNWTELKIKNYQIENISRDGKFLMKFLENSSGNESL